MNHTTEGSNIIDISHKKSAEISTRVGAKQAIKKIKLSIRSLKRHSDIPNVTALIAQMRKTICEISSRHNINEEDIFIL